MTKETKADREERENSLSILREALKPGDTVYTVLRHVSRSGMLREISVLIPAIDPATGKPELREDTYSASRVLRWNVGKHGGIRVDGCGMDMGFHLVYCLSYHLFPHGFGREMTRESTHGVTMRWTPKTEVEAARLYELGYRGHGRNGDESGWDDDGGYALNQRWA